MVGEEDVPDAGRRTIPAPARSASPQPLSRLLHTGKQERRRYKRRFFVILPCSRFSFRPRLRFPLRAWLRGTFPFLDRELRIRLAILIPGRRVTAPPKVIIYAGASTGTPLFIQ